MRHLFAAVARSLEMPLPSWTPPSEPVIDRPAPDAPFDFPMGWPRLWPDMWNPSNPLKTPKQPPEPN